MSQLVRQLLIALSLLASGPTAGHACVDTAEMEEWTGLTVVDIDGRVDGWSERSLRRQHGRRCVVA